MLLTVIFGLPELLSDGCARLSMSNTTKAVLSKVAASVCGHSISSLVKQYLNFMKTCKLLVNSLFDDVGQPNYDLRSPKCSSGRKRAKYPRSFHMLSMIINLEFSEWSKTRKTSPWVHIYYRGCIIDQKLHIPLNHTNFTSKSSRILEQFIEVILS